VNAETGEVWWPEVSKEVFADGVRGASGRLLALAEVSLGQDGRTASGLSRFKKAGMTGPILLHDRHHAPRSRPASPHPAGSRDAAHS